MRRQGQQRRSIALSALNAPSDHTRLGGATLVVMGQGLPGNRQKGDELQVLTDNENFTARATVLKRGRGRLEAHSKLWLVSTS